MRSLQKRNIAVRVAFWKHGVSREPREVADDFLELDPHFDTLSRQR